MTIKVEVDVPDLIGLADRIVTAVTSGTRRAAQELPTLITDELAAGRKPDGSSQPENDERYLARKVEQGFSATPGVRTERLSDPLTWTVEELAEAALPSWMVSPPADREVVVRALEERTKNWRFVGVPPAWLDVLRRDIEAALARVGS